MGISGTIAGDSLSSVVNALAQGRARQLAQQVQTPRPAMSELDGFITLDPILASLHTQYLSARQQHAAARKEHGAESPMADMAADLEDSAWCAMQTRLMELRANGAMMRQVQSMMREAEREQDERRTREADARALNFYNRMDAVRRVKARNKNAVIYEWLLILMLFDKYVRLPFPGIAQQQRIAA